MMKACVIGWPISHSRSPMIHGYWIAEHRLDAEYDRIPVEPMDLPQFLSTLLDRGYTGCNVTLPHKETAFNLLQIADETTRQLGAVNTIYVRDRRLLGTNTDGEGFLNSMRSSGFDISLTGIRTVILGAGGAAASIAGTLLNQGASEIAIVNRSEERAELLRARFGTKIRVLPWTERSDTLSECDLLVNTTSLGMTGQPPLMMNLDRLPKSAVVSDIVYSPLRTALLIDAAKRGNRVVEGLGMLLHQAVRGFELWFGVRPAVTKQLHDLVAKDIEPGFKPC